MSTATSSSITPVLNRLIERAAGRERLARLVLCAALAGGHILLDDLPGTGKTTLAKGLSDGLGLGLTRIQGTSDLLPSDIVGVSTYVRDTNTFQFHKGPVFSQILLCDEINRCPPRTQSALLEAMAEYQVSVDGITHFLPDPFLVIATQNPVDGQSTLTLPDSQLDRFMFHLSMGRLSEAAEKALMRHASPCRPSLHASAPVATPMQAPAQFSAWQQAVERVAVSEPMVDYLWRVLEATRAAPAYKERGGLSTRGAQALVRAAKAWAWLEGRDYVIPEDVAAVFLPVAEHRLLSSTQLSHPELRANIEELFKRVPVQA